MTDAFFSKIGFGSAGLPCRETAHGGIIGLAENLRRCYGRTIAGARIPGHLSSRCGKEGSVPGWLRMIEL
jgi:hypothetical protein